MDGSDSQAIELLRGAWHWQHPIKKDYPADWAIDTVSFFNRHVDFDDIKKLWLEEKLIYYTIRHDFDGAFIYFRFTEKAQNLRIMFEI